MLEVAFSGDNGVKGFARKSMAANRLLNLGFPKYMESDRAKTMPPDRKIVIIMIQAKSMQISGGTGMKTVAGKTPDGAADANTSQ